jgi:hypothetical protein
MVAWEGWDRYTKKNVQIRIRIRRKTKRSINQSQKELEIWKFLRYRWYDIGTICYGTTRNTTLERGLEFEWEYSAALEDYA